MAIMTLKLSGRVAAVMVVPEGEPIMATEQQTVRVTLAGFEGDRHASLTQRSTGRTPHYPRGTEIRNSRQVSLVSTEELAEIAQRLGVPHVAAQWLGANLLIEGIPRLTFLPRGTRLFFPNDAALVVQGENLPCTLAGEAIQVQYPAIDGLAGTRRVG
jgi:hypothetical protein